MCRNTCVTMGAAFSAPEYSLKVADVSKVRTLNAIARNTLWVGAGRLMTDKKTNTSKVIMSTYTCMSSFIFTKAQETFQSSVLAFYNWSNLVMLELRESPSTLGDMQSVKVSHSEERWVIYIFFIIRLYVASERLIINFQIKNVFLQISKGSNQCFYCFQNSIFFPSCHILDLYSFTELPVYSRR